MAARSEVLMVRSAPLNVTPAIERYVQALRKFEFTGGISGLELDYGTPRPPVAFVDRVSSFGHAFERTSERIVALGLWQLFQVACFARQRPRLIQFCDVFSVLPAVVSKFLFGSRLVFDIRDVASLSVSHRGPFVAWVLGTVESFGANLSDAVVVVDDPLLEVLPPSARSRTFVIPNTPSIDLFKDFVFSSDDGLRVNLAGFISHRRNLEAWLIVRSRVPRLALDMYGTIADETTRRMLDAVGLGAVEKLDYAASLNRTVYADAIALMYDPSIGINRYAAPNKYYEGLMLGKPIVCAEGMGLAREVVDWRCGFAVPYGDPDALEKVVECLREPSERLRLGKNARELFLSRYAGRAEREMSRLYRQIGLLGESRF